MNIVCSIIGHNWTVRGNAEGDAQWRVCARCGKEAVAYGVIGGFGAG
jgi:hypothetical protein